MHSGRKTRLSNRSKKWAQLETIPTTQEIQTARQSAFIINDRANKLYNDINSYVKAGAIPQQALTRATNIRIASGRLAIAFNQDIDPEAIQPLVNRLQAEYNALTDNYLPESWAEQNNYSPLIELKEGISLILEYIHGLTG